MNINQSFTLPPKKKKKTGIYMNLKPLKRFPTQFLQTEGALQTEDSHQPGLCWVTVSAASLLLRQSEHPRAKGSAALTDRDLPLIPTKAPRSVVSSSNLITCG